MRNHLFKSTATVFGFWWTVLSIYWLFTLPETDDVKGIYSTIVNFTTNIFNGVNPDVTQIGAFDIAFVWVTMVLGITTVSAGFGYFSANFKFKKELEKIDSRILKSKKPWRGIEVSLGELPQIQLDLNEDPVELPLDSEIVNKAKPEEIILLNKILSIIKDNQNHWSGPEIDDLLLEHSLKLIEESLENPEVSVESLISILIPEMAKIVYYQAKEGFDPKVSNRNECLNPSNWKNNQVPYIKCLSLSISKLEEWWSLDSDTRKVVLYAAKYKNKKEKIPVQLGEDRILERASKILSFETAVAVSTENRQAEKEVQALDDPQEIVYQAFLDMLSKSIFQQPGTPRSVKAIGWKRDGKIFLLESELREKMKLELDRKFQLGLKKLYPKKPSLSSIIVCLMDYFNKKSLLVTNIDGIEVEKERALYKIRAGKNEFNGVLILNLNEDMLNRCPSVNTTFKIEIIESFFQGTKTAESASLSDNEYLDNLLTGKIPEKSKESLQSKLKPTKSEDNKNNKIENKVSPIKKSSYESVLNSLLDEI